MHGIVLQTSFNESTNFPCPRPIVFFFHGIPTTVPAVAAVADVADVADVAAVDVLPLLGLRVRQLHRTHFHVNRVLLCRRWFFFGSVLFTGQQLNASQGQCFQFQ